MLCSTISIVKASVTEPFANFPGPKNQNSKSSSIKFCKNVDLGILSLKTARNTVRLFDVSARVRTAHVLTCLWSINPDRMDLLVSQSVRRRGNRLLEHGDNLKQGGDQSGHPKGRTHFLLRDPLQWHFVLEETVWYSLLRQRTMASSTFYVWNQLQNRIANHILTPRACQVVYC